ncbi:MAG TPA: YHS domain-containing (seleno)protein [Cyclobacteriaceae bacterium]|nr:YHS domain-containing (seleno)protein [Cyclobacteriaceae bacterium]
MRRGILVFVLVLTFGASYAQVTSYFNTDGVAIRGYDPVAYFSESAPVQGSKEFSYTWKGTEWRFKNNANLEVFKSNPEKYAPQFGGWCAYGVSENHKSPTQPAAFTIVDDKLYLNYNAKVKELWSKDIKGHVGKAESNWIGLKNKEE